MKNALRSALALGILCVSAPVATAQNPYASKLNVVTSAMPMLNIGPDARMGGMANAGVAASVDANALYWNPAKLAWVGQGNAMGGVAYTPWLRALVPDVELMFANAVFGVGKRGGLGVGLRYFSLGDITFRDENGNEQGTFRPYEVAADVAYALQLNQNWSAGISLRGALSDLTQGQVVGGLQTKAATTVASDISFYYKGNSFNMEDGQKGQWTGGVTLSNLGAKVKYTESGSSDFIPTNLRTGVGFNWTLDKYNRVTLLADVNKLLVPTRPVRDIQDLDEDGDRSEILAGKDDQVSVMQGIIQSFDPSAKPDGTAELLREFMVNVGGEYWYDEKFAVRGGYQHEDPTKGNRRYFTMGFGIKYSLIQLDFAYLFPADQTVRSPLQNTLRFSALFDLNQLLK